MQVDRVNQKEDFLSQWDMIFDNFDDPEKITEAFKRDTLAKKMKASETTPSRRGALKTGEASINGK